MGALAPQLPPSLLSSSLLRLCAATRVLLPAAVCPAPGLRSTALLSAAPAGLLPLLGETFVRLTRACPCGTALSIAFLSHTNWSCSLRRALSQRLWSK